VGRRPGGSGSRQNRQGFVFAAESGLGSPGRLRHTEQLAGKAGLGEDPIDLRECFGAGRVPAGRRERQQDRPSAQVGQAARRRGAENSGRDCPAKA